MKQVRLNQFEASLILSVLTEVHRRETFSNDAKGSLYHFENINRNMILTLTQLLEESQPKKKVA